MDLKKRFLKWRKLLIQNEELKPTSGRDTCWFKLLEYRQDTRKHEDWMDEISVSLIRSFFSSKEKYPKVDTQKNEKDQTDKEQILIIDAFIRFLSIRNTVPALQELEKFSNIKLSVIRKHFTSANSILEEAKKLNPKVKELVFNEESFTDSYFQNVHATVKKFKRFLITTAVSGKKVDEQFLASLKNYANRNNAMILILPCEDRANRFKSVYQWELDPKLRNCSVVYKDLYLNDNILIDNIKVSAKQINPLTGLERFAQQKGSMILASPKQYLEFVPNSNTKLPRALMTTGAITIADYTNDKWMSKRLSKIAEFDHILGAIILEIEDKEIFHFRQIQADAHGNIIDLGIEYTSDGKAHTVEGTVVVFGDSHFGVHDLFVHEQLKNITHTIKCNKIILHDVFNATSITHHDIGKFAIKAAKANKGLSSLYKECDLVAKCIEDIGSWTKELVIAKSNHDEALDRYLDEGRFLTDSHNCYYGLILTQKMIEGKDPLRYMLENIIGLNSSLKSNWLERDQDYPVYGIECGSHGDLGANGAKSSLSTLEKAYNKMVGAHTHTAGIYRQVYRVGTSSNLKLDYNRGLSSWTHTSCLIYPNGSRQLINIIKKKDGTYGWRL